MCHHALICCQNHQRKVEQAVAPFLQRMRILDNKKIKGTRGEEIIIKAEEDKLLQLNRADLAEKIQWKSKDVDGLGYDIE